MSKKTPVIMERLYYHMRSNGEVIEVLSLSNERALDLFDQGWDLIPVAEIHSVIKEIKEEGRPR